MKTREGPKVAEFLDAVRALCRERGLSLAHEDIGGAFLVHPWNEYDDEWLSEASFEVESIADARAEIERSETDDYDDTDADP